MRKIRIVREFKRDLKKVKRRGKSLVKLDKIVDMLLRNKKLGDKYRVHKLQGNYGNKLECHIEPDWLLIYELNEDYLTLYRTSSHADLF